MRVTVGHGSDGRSLLSFGCAGDGRGEDISRAFDVECAGSIEGRTGKDGAQNGELHFRVWMSKSSRLRCVGGDVIENEDVGEGYNFQTIKVRLSLTEKVQQVGGLA